GGLARRVGSQHRALLAAHRFGTEGGYRAGGDRVPYSARPVNRIGARLRRLVAGHAPRGGPDEDGRPGPERLPGLGQSDQAPRPKPAHEGYRAVPPRAGAEMTGAA